MKITFNKFLDRRLKTINISKKDLAKKSGIDISRIEEILDDKPYTYEELTNIACAIEVNISDLVAFLKVGIGQIVFTPRLLNKNIKDGDYKMIVYRILSNSIIPVENNVYVVNTMNNTLCELSDESLKEIYKLLYDNDYRYILLRMPRVKELCGYDLTDLITQNKLED